MQHEKPDGVSIRVRVIIAALAGLFCLAIAADQNMIDAGIAVSRGVPGDGESPAGAVSSEEIHGPVYRIPLRVHIGTSGRPAPDFVNMLDEINEIWLSQAGICFEGELVSHDRMRDDGLDIWFMPRLGSGDEWNGLFENDHDIRVRDVPILRPAAHPARDPAARTAAHEFGHALGLPHRQDSDDNLMRSKSYGWRLGEAEALSARRAASFKGVADAATGRCSPAIFADNHTPR